MKSFQATHSVSCIIPLRNSEHTIQRAIFSALNQTVLPVEVIVVDDHSTDNSVIRARQVDNPIVRIIEHEKHMGGNAARNTGIINSVGDYVAFLDSDDEWYPQKLEFQLDIIIKNSPKVRISCATTDLHVVNGRGKSEIRKSEVVHGVMVVDLASYLTKAIKFSAGSTLLVEKQLAINVGMFDRSLNRFQDVEFTARLLDQTLMGFSLMPLGCVYLQHKFFYHALEVDSQRFINSVENLESFRKLDNFQKNIFFADIHSKMASNLMRSGGNLLHVLEHFCLAIKFNKKLPVRTILSLLNAFKLRIFEEFNLRADNKTRTIY